MFCCEECDSKRFIDFKTRYILLMPWTCINRLLYLAGRDLMGDTREIFIINRILLTIFRPFKNSFWSLWSEMNLKLPVTCVCEIDHKDILCSYGERCYLKKTNFAISHSRSSLNSISVVKYFIPLLSILFFFNIWSLLTS